MTRRVLGAAALVAGGVQMLTLTRVLGFALSFNRLRRECPEYFDGRLAASVVAALVTEAARVA